MFTRIVVMSFQEGKAEEFLERFEGWREHIAAFEGCERLRLVRDQRDPNVFMTISTWQDVEDLERYRNSELFAEVWPVVKAMFSARAQAWSVDEYWNSVKPDKSERSL